MFKDRTHWRLDYGSHWWFFYDENHDIALVGKITNELLKIIDGTIEKKLRLIKIQSDILYKNGKQSDSGASIVITDEDRKWAENYMKTNNANNEKEYE